MKSNKGIYPYQLRKQVEYVLKGIDLYSPLAVQLLMKTAAQESGLGYYIKQLGSGPALGILQMEPNTFNSHIQWLESKHPVLFEKILKISGIGVSVINLIKNKSNLDKKYAEQIPSSMAGFVHSSMLIYNMNLAIAMARVHYYRMDPNPIPKTHTEQWESYKTYYNTKYGAATKEEFDRNCKNYGL